MHIELTVYPFCEPKQNLSLKDLRNGYVVNCELFRTENICHKLKFIDTQNNNLSEYIRPETISITTPNKTNKTFRLEFDEMYGWINLEKFIGYEGMVEPFELLHETAKERLIEKSKELRYCYNLSSDQDLKYGFLNPIYLIALTIAQNCNGYVQINDDSRVNDFKLGIYSFDEFKQELRLKYES